MTTPTELHRGRLANAQRVVIKVGTGVLTRDDGRLALARLYRIVELVADLVREDRELILVSSGAVGLGCDALGLEAAPSDLASRQACAAIGQSRLMRLYEEGFSRCGLVCGQVLVTEADFDDRSRYLNLRSALQRLLELRVVPVLNENDVVAVDELVLKGESGRQVFGDNDRLSALVASKLDADLLILLTDVDGLFERDPRTDPEALPISRVDDAEVVLELAGGGSSGFGRGGMASKVRSAALAARSGCDTVICSGTRASALVAVLDGQDEGTWFPAGPGLAARRKWIAFAARSKGSLRLDEGAVKALYEGGASLLAAGVDSVVGDFERGDVVSIEGPDGRTLGRGMIACDSWTIRSWCTASVDRRGGLLIRRDHLVLE